MDLYNNKMKDQFQEDEGCKQPSIDNIDSFTFQQIELLIQQQYGAIAPAIVFEYISNSFGKEVSGFDQEDLGVFFESFGDVEKIEIIGKVSVVLFRNFFDANTAREFLQNDSNFKENMKNYFRVRWFTPDDESLLTDVELITRITKYIERYYEKSSSGISSIGSPHSFLSGGINPINSINLSMNNLNLNANLGTNLNCMGMGMSPTIPSNVPNVTSSMMNNYPPHMMHMMNMQNMSMNQNYQNPNTQYPYYLFGQQQNMMRQNMNQMSMGSNQMTNTSTGINSSGTPMNSTQNSTKRKASSMSNNNLDEDRSKLSGNNTGKYTCRFEIQIENDKDFQVARRLIGAKGCNMKKIVEMCSKNQDGSVTPDSVKLRLRGKGSGYKEGPFNKESDEPLHLCISSKFYDRYKTACGLVNDLIGVVFEEYKKYCEKNKMTPVSVLAIRKEEGISSRKGTISKLDAGEI